MGDEPGRGAEVTAAAIEGLAEALERGLAGLGRSIGNGDAGTPMGGLEAHGVAVREGLQSVAQAIEGLAEAITWAARHREGGATGTD